MIHKVKRLAKVYEKDVDSIFGIVQIIGHIEPALRDTSKCSHS